MATEPSNQTTTSGSTGGTASTQTVSASAGGSPNPLTDFRYARGTGVPDILEGKNPLEAAQLVSTLWDTMLKTGMVPQPAAQAQAAPVTTTQATTTTTHTRPTAEDFVQDPVGATTRLLEFTKQSEFMPAMNYQTSVMAQQASALAQMKHPDEFKRWGGEILQYVGGAKVEDRANPQLWEIAIDHVRAKHVDEIAEERAAAKLQQMLTSGTVRPTGAPGGASATPAAGIDLTSDQVPPKWRALLQQRGISQREVEEFLHIAYPGMPREQAWELYMKQLSTGDILHDGKEAHWELKAPGENEYTRNTAPGWSGAR